MDVLLLEAHDGAPEAASGDDTVAVFQIRQHLALLLLPPLLGKKQQNIKNPKDEEEREQPAEELV